VIAAPEEHVRTRDVEGRRHDDDRAPASRASEPRNGPGLATRAVRHGGEAYDAGACVSVRCAQPVRLGPLGSSLHRREREHRCDSAPDERECRRQPPLVPREDDDDVGTRRGGRLGRRPHEEDEAGDEPGRNHSDDAENQAAQHGATVPSPPVSGVLFTCAGQRVDIVTAFKRAGARTVAADVNRLAPALYHADAHAFVPRIDDPQYVPTLRALVHEHDLSLIVPLTDLDHAVLSRAKGELAALVLLPEPEIVEALADKWLAHLLFEELGIGSPPTWLPEDVPAGLEFPVLVKARQGFGSRGIYRCENARELDFFLGYTREDSMVQALCHGEEYSIDVFCDLDRRCLNAVPRTMIESKGGESIKGMTIADAELIEVGRAVSETVGLVGPANIQCFRESDGTHRVTDINPRFGGAFPLPTAAGSRYPELALALAAGERPEPRLGDFRAGLYMTRFFSELVLSAGEDGTLEPFAEELPESIVPPS
jgi:carbamoyl-phosphate synthase large subunit